MKAKVIRPFKDKDNNKKLYDTNTVYEGSDARCAELAKKGFVKIEKDVPKKEEPEKK